MSYTAPMSLYMDFDTEPMYPRWSYATSDARSDPLPAPRTAKQIVTPSPPAPRPPPPTEPVQMSPGVWHEDDDVRYSSEWPPVQEYLDRVREAKRMLPPASNLILALAALTVVRDASDIAHWIFWAPTTYWTIGELVDSVALHRPRLIKTQVPWNGAREFKLLVNSWQQKFTCVVVQQRWYTTDGAGGEPPKRNLRSTTDQPERTVNDYFGLVENEGPSRRRSGKTAPKKTTPSSPPAKRATRRPVVVPVLGGEKEVSITSEIPPTAWEISPLPNRSSGRVRRKVTPSARSPRVITASVENSPIERSSPPVLPFASPSPSSVTLALPKSPETLPLPQSPAHVRNRSGSAQSSASADTVVERSPSVASVETAVGTPSSPKKRKADELDAAVELIVDDDSPDAIAAAAAGMVTRHRAGKKIRTASPDASKSANSQPPSRLPTPVATAIEPRPKSTRPRTKRVRV